MCSQHTLFRLFLSTTKKIHEAFNKHKYINRSRYNVETIGEHLRHRSKPPKGKTSYIYTMGNNKSTHVLLQSDILNENALYKPEKCKMHK